CGSPSRITGFQPVVRSRNTGWKPVIRERPTRRWGANHS
ncbi:MAG: hypothetical protein AVDCRST_MAG64-1745, partial [uncultured Phycisphaerae bacterium]